MIQLRKVRSWQPRGEEKEHSADLPFDPEICAKSIADLFKDIDAYIEQIPENERFNVHYTLGHGTEGRWRNWTSQDVIPFDIDGITTGPNGEVPLRYLEVILPVLKVKKEEVGLVQSGHGLHVIVGLKKAIDDQAWFKKHHMHYRVICGNLQAALERAGLKGKVDAGCFSTNHLLRCPGTINRKKDMADRKCILLNRTILTQAWDICDVAGIPPVSDEDQVSTGVISRLAIDVDEVEKGCGFLAHCRENPQSLSEPEWYAMLSVVSRLQRFGEDNKAGRELAHKYSRAYSGYSRWETDRKIDQALAASGPRTCENIDTMWDGCRECPHWQKVSSPICIKGDSFIATEHSGFHTMNDAGKFIPAYEDLCRYLRREYAYITNKDNGGIYIYGGKCYDPWTTTQIRAFAHHHFDPKPMERTVQEFVAWVTRTQLIDNDWFIDTTAERINFNNGILDLRSGHILPHEPTYGFLYNLPFDYDPSAVCPTFDRFLEEITSNDESIQQLLLEFIGYCLCSNDYWLQKGLLLVGNGANGKSTLLRIIEALAGRSNVSFLSLGELQAETSRIGLEGKLVNISDELPSYNFRNTEMFKKLMGGSVTARRLYQQSSTLRCTTKFIFSCNDIPVTSDTSQGLFRRLTIVPFDNTFEGSKADPRIASRMLPELPGIFNRCYAAYQECKRKGDLTSADRSEKEKDFYRQTVDSVGSWVVDNLHWNGSWNAQDPYVKLDEIFESYNSEARRNEEKPCNKRDFAKHLRKMIDHWDERFIRARIGGERA